MTVLSLKEGVGVSPIREVEMDNFPEEVVAVITEREEWVVRRFAQVAQ